MRAVSLFSGVGGFEQGLQWAGIETVLQVENDPWCLSVLARHWPEVQRIDDVRKVGRADGADREGQRRGVADEGRPRADDAQHRRQPTRSGLCGDIDLVYGGFPCQDVSVAGQRRGLSGDRSGLWHEFHRVLRELRPRWCLIENVPGLLSSGGEPGASTLSMNNGHVRADQAWTSQLVAGSFQQSSLAGKGTFGYDEDPDVLKPVKTQSDGQMIVIGSQIDEGAARPLVARASGYRMDMESETFVVASPDRASDGHHGYSSGRGDGADNLIAQTVNSSYAKTTASAGSHGSGAPVNDVHGPMGVRRLTPRECERLQGWADDWTRYTADGKEIPDSHRYRMVGNGVVAPVAEWIGHRLVRADRWP